MRALGSPRLIYSNVARGNAKFTLVHKMDLVELGDGHARIRNVPLAPAQWHPATCPYNIGLLSSAPRLFGRPPARVRHTTCIGTGAQECVYEADWGGPDARAVAAAGLTAAGLGGLAAAALLLPAALPFAAAGATAAAALAGRRVYAIRRRRWIMLEQAARTEAGDAGRLTASLQARGSPSRSPARSAASVIGAQMLERIPFFAAVHPLVRSAHERWDGSGYPDGLDGEAIPLGARITCACDALHAMTSERPYRRRCPTPPPSPSSGPMQAPSSIPRSSTHCRPPRASRPRGRCTSSGRGRLPPGEL